ncbi:MAG: Xaa-Pro peptidase family protein [Acidobacteria bacterium]|nr:Xaa-Pro peptidase family protein [Acidobacteriota bacterium]MCA1639021.1 Xaa-Pro peptidase family protein [Acidobacteriota bacterium]
MSRKLVFHRSFFVFVCFVFLFNIPVSGQEGIPFFTTDFPPEEFAQRRAKVFDSIGNNAIALIQGEPSPKGYTRFRQSNEFYYLCGIEVPHSYLILNGSRRTATLYLPHRNEGRERSEGKVLSAEDAEMVKKLSGVNDVFSTEMLGEHLAGYARSGQISTIFTPFNPAEGTAMSRDLAVRAIAAAAADPWDGSVSREGRFITLLRERFPQFEIKNLSPALDKLRLIKSPREIALITKATRLSGLALMEAMRSTVPGIIEFELDGMAKYIYYRNGAQGDAYYSLIASGTNAWYPHYNAGKRVMKDGDFLLMDYAPDVGYYMSDVTRMIPVNGKFSRWQRELYGFYLDCYKAILKNIKPGLTAQVIKQAAAREMQQVLVRSKFSKPIYERAAREFVGSYQKSAENPQTSLGHWIGMATHDVGGQDGSPLRTGMVFSIEPALRVPEEKIYIRLEDVIVITDKGADILTTFVPMEISQIEKLMTEEGMLQRYPKDKN